MVVNSTGEYTAVAELMATANKVSTKLPNDALYHYIYFHFHFLIQVYSKDVQERWSDRLKVNPFRRMANINAVDMQRKSSEYNSYINQEEKPLEFVIKEMGDHVRR